MLKDGKASEKSPAQEFVTFGRVLNIIELGAAAGECAEAFQEVFGPDRKASTAAWDFRDAVKHQIVIGETGLITEDDVRARSAQDWDTIHSHFLTNAEDAYFLLKDALSGSGDLGLNHAMEAFRSKIVAGRHLEIALV